MSDHHLRPPIDGAAVQVVPATWSFDRDVPIDMNLGFLSRTRSRRSHRSHECTRAPWRGSSI